MFNIGDRPVARTCAEEKAEALECSIHLLYKVKKNKDISTQSKTASADKLVCYRKQFILTGKCSSKGVILSDTYIIFPSVIIAKKKPSRA